MRIKKRILAVAVSLACAFSAFPAISFAAESDIPTLGNAEGFDKVLSYVNFTEDLPEGVVNDGVDIADGVATFSGGKADAANAILFPESMTESIVNAKTVIVEFVVNMNSVAEHGIIASVGTEQTYNSHIIIGTRNNDANGMGYKTHDRAVKDSVTPGEWQKVRYEITRGTSKIFVNDELVGDFTENTNISNISGQFSFGRRTVSGWDDEGLNGQVTEIRISVQGEYYGPNIDANNPEVLDVINIGDEWPSSKGDYYYDKVFSDLTPGVYKIAYCVSDVNIANNYETRVSPRVTNNGGDEHRCWVDFRYQPYDDSDSIQTQIDENGLSNNIIFIAVINVPEGYNTIAAGAFMEPGLGGTLDQIVLASGNYNFNHYIGYDWTIEKANTADFNEDAGGLLKVEEDAWIPSTRGSFDTSLKQVTVDGVAAEICDTIITATVNKADKHTVVVEVNDGRSSVEISDDLKTITVTAEDGTIRIYTLNIIEKSDEPVITKPPVANGPATVNGKTVLYKDGKAVTGTKIATVSGKTYAVVGGYVKTGRKNQLVKIGSKSYVVNKSGVVVKGSKNKLVKVGSKSYIVNKKGVVVKGAKNKLVKVGKKKYVVNKKGVVQKNKKSVKVGKKTYRTNKKGVATRKKK